MNRCAVCKLPIPPNTPMEPAVTECRSACTSQPCIHGWLENQNHQLCPVCKSVIGGNRFTPIFGSDGTIDDNRNDVPPANQRTEASGAYTGINFNFYWTCVILLITFIMIIAILCIKFLRF